MAATLELLPCSTLLNFPATLFKQNKLGCIKEINSQI